MASSPIQGTISHSAYAPQSLVPRLSLSRKRLRVYLLFFIIMIATAVRFFRLDAQSFWFDEAATLGIVSSGTFHDLHPPAFYLLTFLWLQLGQSEFFLRMLPAMMGVLIVLLMYGIGPRIVGSKAAIVATLLASISPILVWHSQDLRMYSQAVLLVLVTVHYYLRAVQSNTRADWLGYLVAALLAGYTHLYTLFIPLTLSLHLLVFHRQQMRQWLIVHSLFAALYLPWLLVMLNMPGAQVGTARLTSIFNIFYTYFSFTVGYSFGPAVNELRTYDLAVLLPHIPVIAALTIVILVLLGAGVYHQWRRSHETSALILLWAVVPVVLAVILPLIYPRMTFNTRYVLISLPAFLWILASGIEGLERRKGMAFLFVITVFSGGSLYNYYFNSHYAKEDVRSAAAYLTLAAEPDDLIVVVSVGNTFSWYFDGNNPILWNSQTSFDNALTQAAENTDTLWLVQARHWMSDPQQETRASLDGQFLLMDTQQFTGVSIYRYCVNDCAVHPLVNW